MAHLSDDRRNAIVLRGEEMTDEEAVHLRECPECSQAVDRGYGVMHAIESALEEPGVLSALEEALGPVDELAPVRLPVSELLRRVVRRTAEKIEQAVTSVAVGLRPLLAPDNLAEEFAYAEPGAGTDQGAATEDLGWRDDLSLVLEFDSGQPLSIEFLPPTRSIRASPEAPAYDIDVRLFRGSEDHASGIANAVISLRAESVERVVRTRGAGRACLENVPSLRFDLEIELPDEGTGTTAYILDGLDLEHLLKRAGMSNT